MLELLQWLDIDLTIKIVLGIIMLGVGIALQIADFDYVFQNKQVLFWGLLLKLLLLPLVVFFLLELTSLSVVWKFGIVILLLSPGGTTSNIITYWFDGTNALTIFLTTISSLFCIVSIPILVNMSSVYYFQEGTTFSLPFLSTVLNILFIIILPSLLGLWLRAKHAIFALQVERILKPLSVMLLGLVFLVKFLAPKSAGGTEINWAEIIELTPTLLLINLASMLLGFGLSLLRGYSKKDSMTIGIEMGLQNAGLAILIGGVFLANQDLVKPALIYAMFSFWTTAGFGFAINRLYAKKDWD